MVELQSIEHRNLGTVNRNSVRMQSKKGVVILYFSYDTLVGVSWTIMGKSGSATAINEWSPTTGKLLFDLEPNKDNRVAPIVVLDEARKQLRRIT